MMKSGSRRYHASPSFSKTAREWMLSSALYEGIEDEDIRQIKTLLAKGANPNALLPEYGISPFHLAVANESIAFAVQATDICLQHGANPNVRGLALPSGFRSEEGLTPVHLAAMWGCPEVLRVLLANGGDPWLTDCFNKNALDYARSEKQHKCCALITANSGRLNLKQVVLYENDLEVLYKASPPNSRKCASTQTSILDQNTDLCKDMIKGNNFRNACTLKRQKNHRKERLCENSKADSSNDTKHWKNVQTHVDKQNGTGNLIHVPISNSLKDLILNHRGNSVVYEYSPPRQESLSSTAEPWRDVESFCLQKSSMVSELVEKLEEASFLRRSLKHSGSPSLKNVTQRIKPTPKAVSDAGSSYQSCQRSSKSISVESSQQKNALKVDAVSNDKSTYQSCQRDVGTLLDESNHWKKPSKADSGPNIDSGYHLSQRDIGFIFDESQYDRALNFSKAANPGSPPSIGFVLDNLEENSKERGSSLFSDIDSNVGVIRCVQDFQTLDKILTEDETSSDERRFNRSRSSDSIYPYVTCVGEAECEDSGENFESCLENVLISLEEPLTPIANENSLIFKFPPVNSVSLSVNSIINSDENKSTPVNNRLVTSTPEKDESEPCTSAKSHSRAWVEAVISSSSEDELYASVSEEYEYTDLDEGIVLIEKRYLLDDDGTSTKKAVKKGKSVMPGSSSEMSEVSSLSGSEAAYDTDDLRKALEAHGFSAGPINGSTKRVYLRKLKRLRRRPQPSPAAPGAPAYSPELLRTLTSPCDHLLGEWAHLEDSMVASFACDRRPWREGQMKSSFTYLLLDPRQAHDLPRSALPPHSLWPSFLRSVFYVGKGKRSRPYAHLYQAVSRWRAHRPTSSRKIQRILDIWVSGAGVICLHVFLNVIPVEAYTREAAMISALTLSEVTNEKAGEFYGSASCWSGRFKRRLGSVLLHRALRVFLAEGERQLRPADIG